MELTEYKAVSILSFEALAHIIALCTVLPLLHSLFIRYLHFPEHADLALMKVCIFFHIVGTLFMGLSQHPIGIFSGTVKYP
jgi:hypothetical protein